MSRPLANYKAVLFQNVCLAKISSKCKVHSLELQSQINCRMVSAWNCFPHRHSSCGFPLLKKGMHVTGDSFSLPHCKGVSILPSWIVAPIDYGSCGSHMAWSMMAMTYRIWVIHEIPIFCKGGRRREKGRMICKACAIIPFSSTMTELCLGVKTWSPQSVIPNSQALSWILLLISVLLWSQILCILEKRGMTECVKQLGDITGSHCDMGNMWWLFSTY